jgi:primosomal protein N'
MANKKLEDLFNLETPEEEVSTDESPEYEINEEKVEQQESMRELAEFDKITSALPSVKGLGQMADKELKDVADKAIAAYEDLMDLGMNVEARYAGRILEVASTMLKTNLEAKTAKIDKKLKMVELQLKQEKLENEKLKSKNKNKDTDDPVQGEGYVVSDRNSLLERLKNFDKDNDK